MGRILANAGRCRHWLSEKLRDFWTWLGPNHEQVKMAFALIAASYVLFEYLSAERDATIKRTMEFQVRYSQGEVLNSRIKLESYWLNPSSQGDLDRETGTANQKITKVVLQQKLDGNVFVLADFFGQLTTCLQTELCHLETACAVFKRPVVGLRNTYFDLFRVWKERWGENLGDTPYTYFVNHCPGR